MKTATITYHNVYNYGAVLQAYALQKAQESLFIDNVIIDYSSQKNRIFHRIKGTSLKILIVNVLRLMELFLHFRQIYRCHQNFELFQKTRVKLTKKYQSLAQLRENPPKADYYIAGSDQLWNVSVKIHDEFFLNFGEPGVKRASYAVSMGSYEVPAEHYIRMKELINRFEVVSVRERKAKEYIDALLYRDIKVMINCDPVFLLSRDEWTQLAKGRRITEKYILCYPMSGHPLMQKALMKLKELTGYITVVIKTELFTSIKGDIILRDSTPEEFVDLVNRAEYILTTSFHGTAFSTIFNKKFFSMVGGSAPDRIINLLERFGLEDRVAKEISDIHMNEVDYTKANETIQRERAAGLNYLQMLNN